MSRASRTMQADLGPNHHLVGQAGSRSQLSTPCLVLDIGALRRNIAQAAKFAAARKMALRPHAKTHKCSRIARLQIEAGAVGICVATIGEAEAMEDVGIGDILVTSDFTQPIKIARAVALARRCRLSLVADDPSMARDIGLAAEAAGVVIPVHVDVDLGRHRNGVTNEKDAVAVADAIAASPGLKLAGIQAYASHISHVASFADRRAASVDCAARISAIRTALEAAGHTIAIVTGGSTGTLFMDPDLDCYTELQCGSYTVSDVEYDEIDVDGKGGHPFEPAAFVRVSVIGRNWPGRVSCDGGNKHFSAKGTLPRLSKPPTPTAIYRPDSDEHGIIELAPGDAQPPLGTGFELVLPHCDPTINLYEQFHVVDGETLIDVWPIEARGAY